MKLILRVLVPPVAFLVAWLLARFAGSFTIHPLRSGGYEATPTTVVVVPVVFLLTFVAGLFVGNVTLNRYFRERRS